MKTSIVILTLLMGTCFYLAKTQDIQRKIEQESGKGLYAPNAVYRINRVIRTDDPEVNYALVAAMPGLDIQSIKTDRVVKY